MRKPVRPCAEPGCPNVQAATRCPEHEREHRASYDRTSRRRRDRARGGPTYDSKAWRAFRQRIIRERGFRCEECGESYLSDTSALHVHHVHELRDGGAKFDPDNCRVLCRSCHNAAHGKRERRDDEDPPERRGWTFA